MVSVFVSYSHKDNALWDQLQAHLTMLKRQGVIDVWHDRRITAGEDFAGKIDEALNNADVVLALVSPDFLASDYCYDIEMKRALEQHARGEARVIPVILRPCDWHPSPLGKLRATPKDGKPITKWPDADEAFLNVVQDIRDALKQLGAKAGNAEPPPAAARPAQAGTATRSGTSGVDLLPRSGNLRVRPKFTDADKSRFLSSSFDYISNYFEGSLIELQKRYGDVETTFRRVDGDKFIAEVFRGGKLRSGCRVLLRPGEREISYAVDTSARDGTSNSILRIEITDQAIVLKEMLDMFGDNRGNMSMEGAAEHLWSKLMEPLQR